MIKRCVICNKTFEVGARGGRQLVCSDKCRRENNKLRKRRYKAEQGKFVFIEPNRTLVEINEVAKSLGLSYGQYQAQLEAQRMKISRG